MAGTSLNLTSKFEPVLTRSDLPKFTPKGGRLGYLRNSGPSENEWTRHFERTVDQKKDKCRTLFQFSTTCFVYYEIIFVFERTSLYYYSYDYQLEATPYLITTVTTTAATTSTSTPRVPIDYFVFFRRLLLSFEPWKTSHQSSCVKSATVCGSKVSRMPRRPLW